jgi:hypothetical protein
MKHGVLEWRARGWKFETGDDQRAARRNASSTREH